MVDLNDPEYSDIWIPVTIVDDSKSIQSDENAATETGAATKPTATGGDEEDEEDEGSMTAMSTGSTTGLVTSAPTALQTGSATEATDVSATESTGMAAQATALGSFAAGLVAAGLAVAAL